MYTPKAMSLPEMKYVKQLSMKEKSENLLQYEKLAAPGKELSVESRR
jgi:hypothetical protein